MLNELVFVLLGGLLVLLAMTGTYAVPGHSLLWMALGAFLVYWGIRAWARPERGAPGWQAGLRGGSLIFVGAMVLAMAWLSFRYVAAMLVLAGCVLVLRGLLSAALLARQH